MESNGHERPRNRRDLRAVVTVVAMIAAWVSSPPLARGQLSSVGVGVAVTNVVAQVPHAQLRPIVPSATATAADSLDREGRTRDRRDQSPMTGSVTGQATSGTLGGGVEQAQERPLAAR
jgi:hypothetical protein